MAKRNVDYERLMPTARQVNGLWVVDAETRRQKEEREKWQPRREQYAVGIGRIAAKKLAQAMAKKPATTNDDLYVCGTFDNASKS